MIDPAPHILTVEMNPEDGKDFEDWYRTELLPRISRLPGYKRSRRFELSDQRDNPSGASRYLAFHEVRNLDKAFQSEEQHEENLTAWKKKHIEASERTKTEQGGGFVRRGWELIHTEGDPVADMADEVRAKDPIPDSVSEVGAEKHKQHDVKSPSKLSFRGLGRLFVRLKRTRVKNQDRKP